MTTVTGAEWNLGTGESGEIEDSGSEMKNVLRRERLNAYKVRCDSFG